MKQPDFIAILKYNTHEEGGRRTAALSGYRPQVKFHFSEMQTSGQQIFIGQKSVNPGETVTAGLSLLSPQFYEHKLHVGTNFEFREGSKIIGTGKIIEILNQNLLENSNTEC